MSKPGTSESLEALLRFPSELWGAITVLISGEQIGRLKMTGSKRLWSLLCQKRAVESIKLGKDYLVFKRWPAFLNELPQLRELSISNLSVEWWSLWEPTLDLVPRTLTKLQIKMPREDSSFFFVDKDGNALSLIDHVPLLEVLRLNLQWSSKHPWMAHMPANLSSLHFWGYNGSMSLPPSLTHLSMYQHLTGDIKLPENLVHLHHQYGGVDAPYLSDPFPGSLQTLKMSIPVRFETTTVPLSVTSLDMNADFPAYHPTPACSFPTHLTSLTMKHIPSTYWANLPATLKTLQINRLQSSDLIPTLLKSGFTVKKIPIERVPRSITRLTLSAPSYLFNFRVLYYVAAPSELASSTNDPLHTFPPSLTYLSLGQGLISLEAAKQLPASLLNLSTQYIYPEMCHFLPKGLLEYHCPQVIGDLNIVSFLPNSLTRLKLGFNYPTTAEWISPFTGEAEVDPGASSKVPPEEVPKLIQDFWKRDVCLPNLIYLSLFGEDITLEPFFSPQAKLDKLESLLLSGIENLDLRKLRFPPHLRDLVINGKNNGEQSSASAEILQLLPRSLEQLHITIRSDDSALQHLPPKLKSLYILDAPKLTADCVQYLPKSLEVAQIETDFDRVSTPVKLPPLIRSLTRGTCFISQNLIIRHGKPTE